MCGQSLPWLIRDRIAAPFQPIREPLGMGGDLFADVGDGMARLPAAGSRLEEIHRAEEVVVDQLAAAGMAGRGSAIKRSIKAATSAA